MKTLKHWLDTYIAYAVLIGVIIWVVKGEALKFDSERQKYETVIHSEEAGEIIEEIRETFKTQKENSEDAIRSRKNRDSVLKVAIELAKKNSEILERQAVTEYQAKQKIDSINQYWINYNNSQK